MEMGFSVDSNNFWLGLRNMFEIASVQHKGKCELVLAGKRKDNGQWMKVVLSGFSLGSAAENYKLNFDDVIEREGTNIPTSSFKPHKGSPFSTKDRDNDGHSVNCAKRFKGGWWYENSNCYYVSFNGDDVWQESNGWVYFSETRMWIRIKS